MKLFKRLIFALLIICLLLVGSAFLYINMYGLELIETALKTSVNREMAIGQLRYQFPLGVSAHDIFIEGLLQTKSIDAQLSPESILRNEIDLVSLTFVKPVLTIEQKSQEDVAVDADIPSATEITVAPVDPDAPIISHYGPRVRVRKILVKDGRLLFADKTSDHSLEFALHDVQLSALNFIFPLESVPTNFQLEAQLEKTDNPFLGHHVEGRGWVDFEKLDMLADLKVSDEKGGEGLTVRFAAKENNMDVFGRIVYRGSKEEKTTLDLTQFASADQLIYNALSSLGVDVGAEFSFNTKMNNFQIKDIAFKGNVATKEVAEK